MPNPTIPNYPPQGIQAQLDLLYLYNPAVAQDLIDQLNAGLADMEAFKKELEKALQDLQGVLRYKGSVETEADLPTEGNVTGDVWNIISTDENVAWNGTSWDKFGSGIDASVFLTKTDAANTYATKSEVVTSVNTKKGDVVLTGADINATLTGTGDPVTATVTEHIQTLKNDETELGNQVSGIQSLIPSDASETNLLATKADITSGLPDQTGHTGFLQTDGTNASWSDKAALVNNTKVSNSLAIGPANVNVTAALNGLAISPYTYAGIVSSIGGILLGQGNVSAEGAIQIGSYTAGGYPTNDEPYTFKVAFYDTNYTLLERNGTIPSERLASAGTTGQVLSKTDTGMQWVDMSGGVSEVLHDDTLTGTGTDTEPLGLADTITKPKGLIIERTDADGAILRLRSSKITTFFALERIAGSECFFEAGAAAGLIGTRTNHPLQFRTAYTVQMTIDTAGNVTLAKDVDADSNNNQVATTKWVNDKITARPAAIIREW